MGQKYLRGAGAGRAAAKLFPASTFHPARTPREQVFVTAYRSAFGGDIDEERLKADLRLTHPPPYVEAYLRLH